MWKRFQLGVAKIALNCTIAKDTAVRGRKRGQARETILLVLGNGWINECFQILFSGFLSPGNEEVKVKGTSGISSDWREGGTRS